MKGWKKGGVEENGIDLALLFLGRNQGSRSYVGCEIYNRYIYKCLWAKMFLKWDISSL